MTMRVIAIDKFEYANKLRLPGEEFDTDSDKHAELLQLAQRVKIVETRTREMKTDDDDALPEKLAPEKRRYNTRRLKADE
jgi:hypothetical protein